MKKECPICKKTFDRKRMLTHIKKAHGGYSGIKAARTAIELNKPALKMHKSSKTLCQYCNKKMSEQHLKTHIKEWHPREFERDYPLTPKQRLNLALNPDRNFPSEDILDCKFVVSGGGIGVGKGKK